MSNGMQILCSLPDEASRRRLMFSGVLAVAGALFSLLPMMGLYFMLKALLMKPADVMGAFCGVGMAVAGIFLQVIFHAFSTRLSHKAAFDTLHAVRRDILHRLSRVPQGVLDESSAGKLKSQIFDDVEKLEMFYGHHYPEIIGNLLVPVCMIAVIFFMDWRIGLSLLAPIVIYAVCLGSMGRLAAKNFPLMEASGQKLNASIVEYVRGMKEIRMFGGIGSWKRFEHAAEEYCDFMRQWFADCRHGMTVNTIVMSSGIVFVFPVFGGGAVADSGAGRALVLKKRPIV